MDMSKFYNSLLQTGNVNQVWWGRIKSHYHRLAQCCPLHTNSLVFSQFFDQMPQPRAKNYKKEHTHTQKKTRYFFGVVLPFLMSARAVFIQLEGCITKCLRQSAKIDLSRQDFDKWVLPFQTKVFVCWLIEEKCIPKQDNSIINWQQFLKWFW